MVSVTSPVYHKNPSPLDFYTAFRTVLDHEDAKAKILACWQDITKYDSVAYTRVMREHITAVAHELGLQSWNEYYTIDVIMYHEKDMKWFRSNVTYAKYIAVAVEHENQYGCAAEEMNKLQLINTPLAVLITYPPKSMARETLAKYETIIQAADILDNAATIRRQLTIFGYAPNEWEAFVYEATEFVPLTQLG